MTTAITDARDALGNFAERRGPARPAPRSAFALGDHRYSDAVRRLASPTLLRGQSLSTGQKRAIGLIGEAVPPASRSGAIVSRNSQRLRSAQAAASGPSRALSIRWTPM